MLSAPSTREESCGVTIESCHDQIDVIAGRAKSSRSSASSHALPGRSCARQVPTISHAWHAAVVGRRQRDSRAAALPRRTCGSTRA
jgi:hypothetical protein